MNLYRASPKVEIFLINAIVTVPSLHSVIISEMLRAKQISFKFLNVSNEALRYRRTFYVEGPMTANPRICNAAERHLGITRRVWFPDGGPELSQERCTARQGKMVLERRSHSEQEWRPLRNMEPVWIVPHWWRDVRALLSVVLDDLDKKQKRVLKKIIVSFCIIAIN